MSEDVDFHAGRVLSAVYPCTVFFFNKFKD